MPPKFSQPGNDNLSVSFKNLVPEKYRGTDQYLDIVAWNIRYFHHKDKKRVARVTDILTALNADVIVCEEILDQSLNEVAEGLTKRGAGHYEVVYGTTGGNQRVAMLYDLDWVRAKDDIREVYKKGEFTVDGKEVFPRLPLLGFFTSISHVSNPFEFQLMGLHLKSQMGGGEDQRRKAAETLADWLQKDAPHVDADVILIGDWNAAPDADVWKPFHKLEQEGKAAFRSVNDKDDFSHLMFKNKKNFGSRLDLGAISASAEEEIRSPVETVRWTTLTKLLAKNPEGKAIQKYIKTMRTSVSDHMPVVTRFYVQEQN